MCPSCFFRYSYRPFQPFDSYSEFIDPPDESLNELGGDDSEVLYELCLGGWACSTMDCMPVVQSLRYLFFLLLLLCQEH